MNLDQLKNPGVQSDDDGVIVNPNVAKETKPSGELHKVNPAELRGLKTSEEIAAENDPGTEIDQAKALAAEAIEKQGEMVDTMKEVLEQTGELDHEAMESIYGFDPIQMMQNPPKLKSGALKGEREKLKEEMDNIPVEDESKEVSDKIIPIERAEVKVDAEEEEIEKDLEVEPKMESYKPMEAAAPTIPVDNTPDTKSSIPEVSNTIPEFDDDMDKELEEIEKEIDEDTGVEGPTREERLEMLKKDIHEKITPIASKFDISGFSIVNKPVRVSNTIPVAKAESGAKVADWVLFSSAKRITMEGFLGSEIDTLASRTGRNNVQGLREQYNLLYEHDRTPNKPGTLEEWLKSISVMDSDHLFAAAYRASFENTNFVPYDCPDGKCGKSFLSESMPFMKMVKFDNDEAKQKFNTILNSDYTTGDTRYVSEIIPISDIYAVSLREPSIYDAIIKPAYLDSDFYNKYESLVALSTYIDGIYYIDAAKKELRPIDFVRYPNNIGKTEKAKIVILKKVVQTLNSDQYNLIISYINAITKKRSGVSYIIPETNCPGCGAKIEEESTTAGNLLFLRHQLATLANG